MQNENYIRIVQPLKNMTSKHCGGSIYWVDRKETGDHMYGCLGYI